MTIGSFWFYAGLLLAAGFLTAAWMVFCGNVARRKADRLSRTCPLCNVLWPSRRALGAHKKAHRVKAPEGAST